VNCEQGEPACWSVVPPSEFAQASDGYRALKGLAMTDRSLKGHRSVEEVGDYLTSGHRALAYRGVEDERRIDQQPGTPGYGFGQWSAE
tara:strand:+ start:1003 stop:1266 length:264 start_codon:yes stop_codon:yes gene_type:complete